MLTGSFHFLLTNQQRSPPTFANTHTFAKRTQDRVILFLFPNIGKSSLVL